jgi:hypothetical protein
MNIDDVCIAFTGSVVHLQNDCSKDCPLICSFQVIVLRLNMSSVVRQFSMIDSVAVSDSYERCNFYLFISGAIMTGRES